jgi:hypothetical protein
MHTLTRLFDCSNYEALAISASLGVSMPNSKISLVGFIFLIFFAVNFVYAQGAPANDDCAKATGQFDSISVNS